MWITSSSWGVISALLCLCFVGVLGDTILYTNSPRHLVTSENYTSYKLAVPGADPITIIEATQGPPNADRDRSAAPGSLNDMRRQNWVQDEEFLFRRKNTEGHFGKSEDHVDNSKPRTTVYSPDLLKKFLNDYAAKVKKSTPEPLLKKEKLQEILLFDDDNEEANFPLNSQPEEKYNHHQYNHQQQQQDWNQKNKYDDRRYDRPNSGWVTMDVIPWSSSKVSKWQGHVTRIPNRPQHDHNRPQHDHNRPDYVSMEDFDDRYSNTQNNYQNTRPHSNRPSYNQDEFDEVDRFSSPSGSHYHHHSNKNKFQQNNKPYYDYQGSSSNNHYQHSTPDKNKDIYRPWGGDIITDNKAPEFPDHHQTTYPNKNRRPGGSSSYENYSGEYRPYESSTRPTASPDSGNGEWILVSTTKGYHKPRHGQRAVALKPQSFTSHKTVQLSVTAQKPHQSTFSFDSDANQQQQHEDQSGEATMHSSASNRPPVKKTSVAQKQQKKVVKKVMNVKSPGVDSSAVLAAVGAGMVPATVAMLMPMIAGRRKKRDLSAAVQGMPRNVTHFPDLDYEETLPRILQQHVR